MFQAIPLIRKIEEMLTPSTLRAMTPSKVALRCWRRLCLLFIHPPAHGSEVSPAAQNTLDSARIPRASKLLICGLFQKGRVLAQDGTLKGSPGEQHGEKLSFYGNTKTSESVVSDERQAAPDQTRDDESLIEGKEAG